MPGAWQQFEGRVIDGTFRLGRYVGGSEHTAVFLTERDHGHPKSAAIKLISADPGTAELQLFRWKLIAKLSHPHLLQLFAMGRCQLDETELLYVVMERADENLAQVLPSRSLTPAEARELLVPALDALSYLHAHGFVHGRLKPSNLLVVQEQLKLSSDGLCRIGERDSSPPPGIYDPPEAAEESPQPARDVWSLGVTLVQALTQLLPVRDGREGQTLVLPDTLPPPFLEIARNSLHRDPQQRWTLADIAAQLQNLLPIPAKQAAPQQREAVAPHKPRAQRRFAVPAVAAALILATVLGARLLNREPAQTSPSTELDLSSPQPAQQRPAQTEPRPSLRTTVRETKDAPSPAPSSVRSTPRPATNTATSGIVPGQVLQQVLPDVPRSASNTIQGTVRVSVRAQVDPAGEVAGVQFVSAGPSRYFARLASEAARRWKFTPARRDGRDFPSAWILRFEFTRSGTRAIPAPDLP
jgi:TonB family protein